MSRNPADDSDFISDKRVADESGGDSVDADPLSEASVVEVVEFNSRLGSHVEDNSLEFDYVVGDVSDCSEARSGHTYFDLTGEDAAISCALWSYRADQVTADPEDGLRVAVSGSLSFYEQRGSITLVVDDVIPIGESEYEQVRAETREQLAAAGLLAEDRKQPLPDAPSRVGLVTSADSNARSDAVRSIHSKHPGVDIVVQDASVQGEEALPSLMTAIETVDDDPAVDLIVVTRGGGANATLRVFDDLALCTTVAETDTPVVVGIGHERDRPLVDEVADQRVMTPTDVGNVIPDREARLDEIRTLRDRLEDAHERAVTNALESRRDRLDEAHTSLVTEELTDRGERLETAYDRHVRSQLNDLSEQLTRAYETTVAAQLNDLAGDLDAGLAHREQATAFEAEREALVNETKTTIRRQRLIIAVLALFGLALTIYILYP